MNHGDTEAQRRRLNELSGKVLIVELKALTELHPIHEARRC